ncbi:GntR family transcriptional regulator [Pikeienuella sp. HZG-20]|uniref:GntR family transcriptional regulator n=1 Tax=Paludibacillus litoralis TaxID=3133267 RepID=UPI0030EB551F
MAEMDQKPKSNAATALERLRALIFDGSLAAGSDHLESELALRLNMSRTPVREALLILDAQGLLDVRPRKGVRILPVSLHDMAEIYDVLTELESMAARDAALKAYSARALAKLSGAIDRMDAALAVPDLEAWAVADDDFHAELVLLGGNSRVQSIVAMMSDQVRRARAITLHMRPLPVKSNADHRGVLDAIARGDGEAAASIHRSHRIAAKQMLIDLLKRHRLTSI